MLMFLGFGVQIFLALLSLCKRRIDSRAFSRKIYSKLVNAFRFAFHYNLIIEGLILICISSLTDMYEYIREDDDSHKDSCVVSIFFMSCIFFFTFFILIIWRWSFSSNPKRRIFQSEVFSGLKNSKLCRFFPLMFIFRRVLLCLVVVCKCTILINIVLTNWSTKFACSIYFGITFTQCWYILIVRPFDTIKENLTECLNEVFYCVFCGVLIPFSDKDTWSGVVTTSYYTLLQSNILILCFISFCNCHV